MWTELERLKKQIAYDAEEDQLKQNLAWAKVHVSEQESAALLERIAKKNEVMRLLIPSEGADTLQLLVTNFAFHIKLDISSPRTWQGPRRGWKRWRGLSKIWRRKGNTKWKTYNESERGNNISNLLVFHSSRFYFIHHISVSFTGIDIKNRNSGTFLKQLFG